VVLSFAVVCEAPADRDTACTLADRVVCREIDWIEAEHLPHLRQWRGRIPSESCLLWKDVPGHAQQLGIKLFGHFNNEPGAPDAHVARQALALLKRSGHVPHAVILVRDADDQPARRRGLEQAKGLHILNCPVIVGVAEPKRECWVLAGFSPCTPEEENRFEGVRQDLGFDPSVQAHQLTAKPDDAKRSAKRVLGLLSNHDKEREARCWAEVDLLVLIERGARTGLAAYLDEIRVQLVPLFVRPITDC
jgi:hypothetical protein